MSESDNLPQVEAALKAYKIRFEAQVGKASAEISARLEGFGRREIKGDRRGVPYPAMSGQPPMNVTGNLRRSIRGTSQRKGFGVYSAVVGADMVYARAVEMGDPYNPPSWKNGQRFPFLSPALDKFVRSGLLRRIIIKHLGAA
jgi:hypothetical protein